MNSRNHPVRRAAEHVGSLSALAARLGVTKSAVHQWMGDGRQVPAEHCPAIEEITGGSVKCEELRPDMAWSVLRACCASKGKTRARG